MFSFKVHIELSNNVPFSPHSESLQWVEMLAQQANVTMSYEAICRWCIL